ncbi:MAG TPA: DUF2905 domain-containing protein [Cyclobacteriaceae bacterium]|nr:DUF2905 domain-containing protein [Cyclobacteriaceae bacterium]
MISVGKILIFAGFALILVGLAISYGSRIPFLGKLPGDIFIERGNTRIFIPITTSILLSLLISLVLFIINKLRG